MVSCEFGCSPQGCLQQQAGGDIDMSWISLDGIDMTWVAGISGAVLIVVITVFALRRRSGKKGKKKDQNKEAKKEEMHKKKGYVEKEDYVKRKDIKEPKKESRKTKKSDKKDLGKAERKEALSSLKKAFNTSPVIAEETTRKEPVTEDAEKPVALPVPKETDKTDLSEAKKSAEATESDLSQAEGAAETTQKPLAETKPPAEATQKPSGEQAYCMKCKKKVTIKDGHIITMKNGKNALKGICSECGGNVIKLGIKGKVSDKPSVD